MPDDYYVSLLLNNSIIISSHKNEHDTDASHCIAVAFTLEIRYSLLFVMFAFMKSVDETRGHNYYDIQNNTIKCTL